MTQKDPDRELGDLIAEADKGHLALVDQYATVEEAYRVATNAGQVDSEATSTNGAPASLMVMATSAR